MRYESTPEFKGDWIGFAVEGVWNSNARLRAILRQMDQEHAFTEDHSSPNEERITGYYRSFVSLMKKRKQYCPDPDFFLVEQPTLGPSGNKDPNEVILVGVHNECVYKLEDFVGIARKLGFQETDRNTEEFLAELVREVMTPYMAPCMVGEQFLKNKGYTVFTP